MADVILVHGTDYEQLSADSIEREWAPDLAGGVRNAGCPGIADRLWRQGPAAGGFVVRAAFYGGLFRRPGTQGAGGPAADDALAEELAMELLRAAEHSENPDQRRVAREELAALGEHPAGEAQGLRSRGRSLVARLARLPWFASYGMAFAERAINTSLQQVTRYLTDDAIRAAAQQAVLDLVDARTRVIVAHSLGSVVAYEVCLRLEQSLPLLVTIGSPLGLANIVYHRLRPQPPVFPPQVQRWVNIADRNDVVAAEPDLGRFFSPVPDGAVFDPAQTLDNGRDPHFSQSYLTAGVVGQAIAQALSD